MTPNTLPDTALPVPPGSGRDHPIGCPVDHPVTLSTGFCSPRSAEAMSGLRESTDYRSGKSCSPSRQGPASDLLAVPIPARPLSRWADTSVRRRA